MTLCPIALAIGCKKCPAFEMCPLKAVIGDQKNNTKDIDVKQAGNIIPVKTQR